MDTPFAEKQLRIDWSVFELADPKTQQSVWEQFTAREPADSETPPQLAEPERAHRDQAMIPWAATQDAVVAGIVGVVRPGRTVRRCALPAQPFKIRGEDKGFRAWDKQS
jgi:hypothetical protein